MAENLIETKRSLEKGSIGGRPIRSVLVLTKHRFIGDTIVAIPLLRAAREVFPEARIRLVTGTQAAMALRYCPYVDDILSYAPKTAARTAAASARLSISQTQQMVSLFWHDRPDLCLIPDRSFRAALAANIAGGRIRSGFDSERRGALLTHLVHYGGDKHESELCLDILRAVAPEPTPGAYSSLPRLFVSADESEHAEKLLLERGISRGSMLIGMQPGANDPYVREWRPERFAALADRLASATGARIALLGVGEERAISERVAAAMTTRPPVILTGETKLREALAIISRCRLWISNDGGLLHAAVGLGTATVGIFGPTKAHRWGYFGPGIRTMFVAAEPNEHAFDSEVIRRCLDAVTTDQVYDAALSLLSGDEDAVYSGQGDTSRIVGESRDAVALGSASFP